MRYIYTIFDYAKRNPRPLVSGVVDNEGARFHVFYMPKTGLTLWDIEKEKEAFFRYFEEPVVVNDFKAHLSGFKFDIRQEFDVYSRPDEQLVIHDLTSAKKVILQKLIEYRNQPIENWMMLLANVSVVYQYLENRGVFHGFKRVYPRYDFTLTGRSKTLNFPLQGATENDCIRHPLEFENFVHLDWVAADMRVAAWLSADPDMEKSFLTSDPYTMMHESLPEVPREECKIHFLRSIYSLDYDSPFIAYYPTFQKWMREKIDEIQDVGYSETVLGRRFYLEDWPLETVFNAMIQGTVAQAMQLVLTKLFNLCPEQVLTEVHDSVILCVSEAGLVSVVKTAAEIMKQPFDGILPDQVTFPLKVNIGKEWRKWQTLKELR